MLPKSCKSNVCNTVTLSTKHIPLWFWQYYLLYLVTITGWKTGPIQHCACYYQMLDHISYASQDENTFSESLFTQGASIITKDFRIHYSSNNSPIYIIFKTSQGSIRISINPSKSKVVPLQAWSGPEGSRKLRFPDFMTTAQDGGKVVSLMHRPPLPPGNTPGTHFS